jgi:alpha-L-fucosidase
MKYRPLFIVAALGALALAHPLHSQAGPPAETPAETPEQFQQRVQWWRDAKFGMFIHWDMSSVAGSEISWSRGGTKPLDISGHPAGYVEDKVYDHLYEKFNPVKFDAASWVKLAQDAGAKYIVLTTKHHGGFCMWDTKLTDYNIMHTPFKRDVVKELVDACHKAGMRFGVYYSPRDWHHPDYGIGDNRKYVDYMNGQMRELLTKYGPVDILWFDSYGRGDLLKFWHEDETWDLLKSLAPKAVINNRLCELGGYNHQPAKYRGDFNTPEQSLGGFDTKFPWESCMTVQANGGWSYHRNSSCKPVAECLRYLIACATGGGNLLLDVGPDELGEIPANQADRFLQIGQWLKKYGDTIYGTRGGPIRNDVDWGGVTHRGSKIYVHVLNWPSSGSLHLPLLAKLGGDVVSSRLLTADADIKVTRSGDDMNITLDPKVTVNQVDTIVELTMGAPVQD